MKLTALFWLSAVMAVKLSDDSIETLLQTIKQ